MYYITGFFLIVYCCIACSSSYSHDGVEYCNKLAKTIDKKLAQQGYCSVGIGGSYKAGTIRYIIRKYQTQHEQFKTIEEARRSIVPVVELFLKTFNEDKHIRPSLYNFPFRPQNVKIGIACIDDQGHFLREPFIYSVYCASDKIWYSIWEKDPPRIRIVHKESFEEAKAILEKEKVNQ